MREIAGMSLDAYSKCRVLGTAVILIFAASIFTATVDNTTYPSELGMYLILYYSSDLIHIRRQWPCWLETL